MKKNEITVAQAATRADCSTQLINTWIHRGRLRTRKFGWRRFVDRESLEAHLYHRRQPDASLEAAKRALRDAVARDLMAGASQGARAARNAP